MCIHIYVYICKDSYQKVTGGMLPKSSRNCGIHTMHKGRQKITSVPSVHFVCACVCVV